MGTPIKSNRFSGAFPVYQTGTGRGQGAPAFARRWACGRGSDVDASCACEVAARPGTELGRTILVTYKLSVCKV